MELDEWLSFIPLKKIINIGLNNKLTEIYNKKTKLNYIISFDVEFIRYLIKNEQKQNIHEMGGIILIKKNNKWYLYCIFHFNLKPLITNINQYYFLKSLYNTVSDKTNKKLIKIENKILPENNINNFEKMNITKIYLSKTKINKLVLLRCTDNEKLEKKLGKIKHMIKGSDLIKYPEYDLFKKSIYLINNDKEVLKRQINYQNKFINLTNLLFSKSLLIVKGKEDINALKNHTLMLNEKYIELNNIVDIAEYNDILHKKCNSAELEKTYYCLSNLNFTNDYKSYLKIIKDFTNLKAHNPLVDAYYTWIIYNIFLLNKIE